MILVLLKRFLGKGSAERKMTESGDTPEVLVLQIQQGDLKLRNQFITDYQPFVAKVTSRFCKRYIDPARDDEFAVALTAFNEAVNQFSPGAGRSFLGFAETVIRRRLIDYVRKEQRFSQQVPYSSFELEDEEENAVNPVEIHQAIQQYELQKEAEDRQAEIIELSRALQAFDIRFSDLVDASPKHTDSREVLVNIGLRLGDSSSMMETLLAKKMLPIKELLEVVEVSRKTLERNRKYIIAVALIHNGPYPHLREYLKIMKPQPEEGEGT